jgi:diadenosine tetraphosphate (Ap4A) HIT family hydrolase
MKEACPEQEKVDNDCLLCQKYASRIFESKYFFVIYDDNPLREGHVLIVSRRHVEDLTLLSRAEFCDLYVNIQEMVSHLLVDFGANGYNLGVNSGEVAGQTIPHLHIHFIPRYLGDVPDPRGGIRKFLPDPLKDYP